MYVCRAVHFWAEKCTNTDAVVCEAILTQHFKYLRNNTFKQQLLAYTKIYDTTEAS